MNISYKETANQGFDTGILICILLLVGFGVVMVYSSSAVVASYQLKSSTYFLKRQILYASVGIIAMIGVSFIDYHFYKKIIYPLLALTAILLVMCHTPFGRTINGASRWIGLGPVTIQPAEAAKIALVLWLSYSLAKKKEKIKTFSIGILPHLLIPGTFIILCLMQPDFGTSFVIAIVTFSLLFVAGAKFGYILMAVVAAAPIGYFLIAGSQYRLKRILAFLDPLSNRFEHGYQLTQSLFGFGAGGLTGVGLGDGRQKLFFLPEAHNDFIAAIIAEELGVIAIWVVLMIFAIIIVKGTIVSIKAKDHFGTYLAFGLTLLVGVQMLINTGVATGLLPTKGLNLPFVSFGGTALLVTLTSMGILLNISKKRDSGETLKTSSFPENSRRPEMKTAK